MVESKKKTAAVLLFAALSIICLLFIFMTPVYAETVFREGTYTGTYEKTAMSGVGIQYDISAAFAGGKYSYNVRVQLLNGEYDAYDDAKTGEYTVSGNTITFSSGNLESAEITGEGSIKVYGTLSDYAFAPAYAELTWVSDEKPEEVVDDDDATSETVSYELERGETGDYLIGSGANYVIECEGEYEKFSGLKVDGVVLASDCYTAWESSSTSVRFTDTYLNSLSVGRHYITFVYTDGESDDALLRVTDGAVYEDSLKSGNYELKNEDFIDEVGVHRHPCIITIDREDGTFIIHDTDDPVTDKGSGTLSFDSETGEYIMTYTAGGPETQDDNTTLFVYEDGGLVFKSPLRLGRSKMNTRDENGAFVSYTAKAVETSGDTDADTGSDDAGDDADGASDGTDDGTQNTDAVDNTDSVSDTGSADTVASDTQTDGTQKTVTNTAETVSTVTTGSTGVAKAAGAKTGDHNSMCLFAAMLGSSLLLSSLLVKSLWKREKL